MKLRAPIVLFGMAAAACSLVRPVVVNPPEAPPAFVTNTLVPPSPVQASAATGETKSAAQALRSPEKLGLAQPAESQPAKTPGERVTESAVWWSAFANPALDDAIQECFRNNFILRDVRGLIYENMTDPTLPQGWWYPLQVGVLVPAGARHIIANIPPSKATLVPGIGTLPPTQVEYNIANIDFGVNYQLDVFGTLDAQRRAGMNFAEQQRQLTEARVQDLAVRIAQVWFDILETRALKNLNLAQTRYNKELYELVRARFEQHLTPRLVVLQQEQLLLNLQSQAPIIDSRLGLLNSELKSLLGRMPTPADDIVPLENQLPDLPPAPDIGTPDDLNANSPEMRLAELRVAEVEHRINQNLASWLPTVNLVASVGATTFDLKEPPYGQSLVGVNLTWPIFDGRRLTEARQLPMQLRRRKIQYELTLRAVVGRVQDAVVQENNRAQNLRLLRAQVELGARVLAEARRQFEQGQSDYLPVLTALTNLVELERANLQAQRLLLNHRIEFYRSLGGTWSYDVTKPRPQ
jgi:outer membrane protein, multidrug efflux system